MQTTRRRNDVTFHGRLIKRGLAAPLNSISVGGARVRRLFRLVRSFNARVHGTGDCTDALYAVRGMPHSPVQESVHSSTRCSYLA